jgi:hypothetical protein
MMSKASRASPAVPVWSRSLPVVSVLLCLLTLAHAPFVSAQSCSDCTISTCSECTACSSCGWCGGSINQCRFAEADKQAALYFGECYYRNDAKWVSTVTGSCPDPCANVQCGAHGVCVGGSCRCSNGYTGSSCSTAPAPAFTASAFTACPSTDSVCRSSNAQTINGVCCAGSVCSMSYDNSGATCSASCTPCTSSGAGTVPSSSSSSGSCVSSSPGLNMFASTCSSVSQGSTCTYSCATGYHMEVRTSRTDIWTVAAQRQCVVTHSNDG